MILRSQEDRNSYFKHFNFTNVSKTVCQEDRAYEWMKEMNILSNVMLKAITSENIKNEQQIQYQETSGKQSGNSSVLTGIISLAFPYFTLFNVNSCSFSIILSRQALWTPKTEELISIPLTKKAKLMLSLFERNYVYLSHKLIPGGDDFSPGMTLHPRR